MTSFMLEDYGVKYKEAIRKIQHWYNYMECDK